MEKISIVALKEEQYDSSIDLFQFAFQRVKSPEEIEKIKDSFRQVSADRWAAMVDDKMAAQACVFDLQTYVGGKLFEMGGVAGVSTWPEYRRQGLVEKLLVHSLIEMKKKGQTLSFLAPFSFSFYRKYGWSTFVEEKSYTLDVKQLPPRMPMPGKVERLDGPERLYPIYEQFASRYNGSLKRLPLWWEQRISTKAPKRINVYSDQNGTDQGYFIYEVSNRELIVEDWAFLNEEARAAIWTFIAQHDSMIERVKLSVPVDDILPDLLPDPRIKQEIVPYFMARIVDLEMFLSQYPFQPGKAERFKLNVSDEHAVWNSGQWELIINEQGEAKLHKQTSNFATEEKEESLKADIGDWTSLLMSYRTGEQLSSLNRIHGPLETINRLQSRIPERTTYLPDFF
ncbi:enhanced intracellular survival protein Eis [Paenibacillus sp. GCM10027627]|uniref:GNAT family N-acetyltransferase n=1 Tax=unclassified Paenibacillus TaxID=185978 RepID=UPI00363EA3DB